MYKRGSSVISSIRKMQQKGMSCREEQRARGDIKQEIRRDKIVWVYRGGGTVKGCKRELHTRTNKIMMC